VPSKIVRLQIGEYDAELHARQKEYEQALTAYNELQDKIKVTVRNVL